MTALPLHTHPPPPSPAGAQLQHSPFNYSRLIFLFLVPLAFLPARHGRFRGEREVPDRVPGRGGAHQGAADPQLPQASDHLVQRRAQDPRQQPHVSRLSPRLGPAGRPARVFRTGEDSRLSSICLLTHRARAGRKVYEQILVQSPCSSAQRCPAIKQVIILPLLTLQAGVIEG